MLIFCAQEQTLAFLFASSSVNNKRSSIPRTTKSSCLAVRHHEFKIQVVLLLIGRYFSHTGKSLDMLFSPDVRLNEADLEELKTIINTMGF